MKNKKPVQEALEKHAPAISPEEAAGTASFEGLTQKKEETFLDRLKKEELDLAEKCEKLASFISSDNFGKIESNQRRLLIKQLGHMREYHAVLKERITLLA